MYVSEPVRRPGDPEPQVVEACRRGDPVALDAVFRQQLPDLERLIARLVGPNADVEDLVQQTLIQAIKAFPRYRGEASIRTWLARIAVNNVRMHFRRPERRRKVSLELVPFEPIDHGAAPDRTADRRVRLARLFHHLDAISAKKRIAFALTVLEGHSIEEVAALMGATRAATKSRVFWARKELLRRARRDPLLRDLLGPEDADVDDDGREEES